MKIWIVAALITMALGAPAYAAGSKACPTGVDPTASAAFAPITLPPANGGSCNVIYRNGYPEPDPTCTPGAINPTVGLTTLKDPTFRTSCERDMASSPGQKAHTYDWYGIDHPSNNRGQNQVCELDHLVSLELGGADTLDNIWPQCGLDSVSLEDRYFKQKDVVENYLAEMVRTDQIDLATAQHGIATDWTQFLDDARKWAASKHQQ